MGIAAFDAAILQEAKQVTGNKKLRQKDIVEWSTGDVTVEKGEQRYFLPELRINIAVESGTTERGNPWPTPDNLK